MNDDSTVEDMGPLLASELAATLRTLSRLARDPQAVRDLDPAHRRVINDAVLALTGRRRRSRPAPAPVSADALESALLRVRAEEKKRRQRPCYICRAATDVSVDAMCAACRAAEAAVAKSVDGAVDAQLLWGFTVVVTGGRVNIGYATARACLRLGATVIVTTRFVDDAVARFAAEADAAAWRDRVSVYGLDLRDLPGVEAFAAHLCQALPAIDAIIHNAAQTLPMSMGEQQTLSSSVAPSSPTNALSPSTSSTSSTNLSTLSQALATLSSSTAVLTTTSDGVDDALSHYGQAPHKSWQARVEDVSTRELLEVLLVNAAAPFVLTRALLPLLRRSDKRPRTVVNVTSSEGRFSFSPRHGDVSDDDVDEARTSAERGERRGKSVRHPHLNMAKAALNMLTRTSASELVADDVVMVGVDPGWVSGPLPTGGFDNGRFPLDADEAARRVLHPLLSSAAGRPLTPGVIYKHYRPAPW